MAQIWFLIQIELYNKISNNKNNQSVAMKGVTSINPIFEEYSNLTNPQIFSISPLVVADHRAHSVYFKNEYTSIKIQPKIIINCCYSKKYGVLMLLTEDGRLRIYTQNLDQIARLPWQSKYSVGLQYLNNDSMLMIGATQIELLYVKVHSNIKSTKFVSSMSFNIEKKQKYIVEPQTKLTWNKGFNYSQSNKILYIWSSKDINFYSLKKLHLISHIPSLTKKQMSITYVLYNTNHKYTITGLINGIIKVWRLPVNINQYGNCSNPNVYSSKDYILIHNYIKHSKSIDKIIQANYSNSKGVNNILISSSLELSVCFWSLQTFQLLRFYDFQAQYSSIFLHNSVYSLATKDKNLGVLQWGKNLQFITDVTSEVISFDKYQKQFSFTKDKEIDSVQITLGSNIGFQIRDKHLDFKDLNKIQIQYVYPPLKAKGIQQIISSPYNQNQYYLLVQNGEIFKLRIEQNSGKIQESYQIQKAKDIELHQLNQLPTIIGFLPILPPKIDSEINDSSNEKKLNDSFIQDPENKKNRLIQLKLIVIGCSKGSVVFFKLQNFQNIYTRITYHRQPIKFLQSFTINSKDYIASCCQQNYLKIIQFDNFNEKAQCIIAVNVGIYLTKMIGFEDRLGLVFIKGFFQIFEVSQASEQYKNSIKKGLPNSQYSLQCLKNFQGNDHEAQIYSIDCDRKNKLILTAGADNKLKIWTYHKVLIYQIFLDEGLKCAIWFRNMQMLVSHNLKILYFRNIGLKVTQEEVYKINQQFVENNGGSQRIQSTIKLMKQLHAQDTGFKQQAGLSQSQIKRQIIFEKQSPKNKSLVATSPKNNFNQSKSFINKNQLKIQLFNDNNNYRTKQKSNQKKRQSNFKTSSKRNRTQNKPKSHSLIEQIQTKQSVPSQDLDVMRKHLEEMRGWKKQANQSILPKIGPKNQDIFDNFMRSKLLNKKILTRRDITLNRIIMKNIIKDHFGNDNDVVNNLKLDF